VIVVSNTSPLNYLILLGHDDVLPAIFGAVVAPPAVVMELSRAGAAAAVREWMCHPPPWLGVRVPRTVDRSLDLDAGESEAIALARELNADRILLDEAKARRVAMNLGLRVAGTLAVLHEASDRGLLDFARTIEALQQTTFYLDEKLVRAILDRIADRPA